MNALAGKVIAAVGVVLAFVGIWVDALPGLSYWHIDGTLGVFALVLACLAALFLAAGFAGRAATGLLFAVGAVMLGFYAEDPAILAFDDWDQTRAGMWLALAAGALIVIGAGWSYLTGAAPSDTPSGLSGEVLVAGLGIALVFPGIFLDAVSGASYWKFSSFGHSLGVVMLVLTIVAGLVWVAGAMGIGTRGLDQAVTLVLLGLVAFLPVLAAFQNLGTLSSGAWIALAGGILAAGGTWAARGAEAPRAAVVPS